MLVDQFAGLFQGRNDAWGVNKGQVRRGTLTQAQYREHLQGQGPGLGVFPLRDDGTVMFAAVDLDEPDFEAACTIQELLPGTTWIERSRSGNYHVWAFFSEPIEAWVPRAIMQEVLSAVGFPKAERFPKQDKLLEGMLGNYINLPYHGNERVILEPGRLSNVHALAYGRDEFIDAALATRNDPDLWRRHAQRLGLAEKQIEVGRDQGTRASLHCCAEYIIKNRETNPITEGHRHIVLFNLAKMLLDYDGFDEDEAWTYLEAVNDAGDSVHPGELKRIFHNARRGGWTSTGCDDPIMAPYVDPECPIAHA